MNIPLKAKFSDKFIYEITLGNDSYNINLEPNGNVSQRAIFYYGLGLGYQFKKKMAGNSFIGATLNGSLYNFVPVGSSISIYPFSEKSFSSTAFVNTYSKFAFVSKLSFSYNWQTENLRSFSFGFSLATSLQNVLRGEFVVNDGLEVYEGTFNKKHSIIGVHLGMNVSKMRRDAITERRKQGIPKLEERLFNTFSKFSFYAGLGSNNPVYFFEPNKFIDLNFITHRLPTYFIAASRSFKVLNRFEGVWELSLRQVESRFSYKILNNIDSGVEEIKLTPIRIASLGLGYNFLKNKKQKENFFQIAALIKANYSFHVSETFQVTNPDTGEVFFDMETDPYPFFFSFKINTDYNLKSKKRKYWKLGLFFERGDFLTFGMVTKETIQDLQYFDQINTSVGIYFGINLL